jgi:hypothetical protein
MTLRDVLPEDLPVLFEHQNDAEAARMAAFAARDWHAFMAHWRDKVLGNAAVRKKTIVIENDVAGHVVAWDQ